MTKKENAPQGVAAPFEASSVHTERDNSTTSQLDSQQPRRQNKRSTQPKFTWTDQGNSERMFDIFGDKIRYVAAWKQWLYYDKGRWSADVENKIGQAALKVVDAWDGDIADLQARALKEVDAEKRKELDAEAERLAKWVKSCRGLQSRNRMIEGLKCLSGIQIPHDVFDTEPLLLNCPNGTVDLRTSELRPHNPADMLLKQSPTSYNPKARFPQWEALLRQVMGGDEEMVDYLQRVFGYAATGETTEQVYFMFVGNGQNGKTTVLEILQRVLGADYTLKPNASLVVQRTTEGHPTEIARLFGKRFVLMSETEEGKNLNEALVKDLTGTTTLSARRMREDFWEFTPSHKLFIDSNSMLTIRGLDKGIWRRTKVIHFGFTIPEQERDINFAAKLLEREAEGILAWVVEGAKKWKQEGLKHPAKVQVAVDQYQKDSDVLGGFIYDVFEEDPQSWESNDTLYGCYKEWMETFGHRPKSVTEFGKDLERRGFEAKKQNGVRGRLGLRLYPVEKRMNLSQSAQADVAEAAIAGEKLGHPTGDHDS